MQILLADDDPIFVDVASYALARRGHSVTQASSDEQALRYCRTATPDLVLLNVALGGSSALGLCRQIRTCSSVPVIIFGVQASDAEIMRGYESGADDCVVVPFSLRQLQIRVDAMLRRRSARHDEGNSSQARQTHVGDLLLEPTKISASIAGTQLALSRIEFLLLNRLARNAGDAVGRDQLVMEAWPSSVENTDDLLKSHISRLRRKLRAGGGNRVQIEAVRGVGYRLTLPPVLDMASPLGDGADRLTAVPASSARPKPMDAAGAGAAKHPGNRRLANRPVLGLGGPF